MRPEDAVTLQVHNRITADTLKLSHCWSFLDAEHVVMLRPRPHDFSLHGSRHYLALLNACRKDGETTADGLPRSTLRDGRGRLIFIPAGCRLQGWAKPGATPVAFTAAYLDPEIASWLGAGERQLFPMLHFEHPLLVQMMLQLNRILAQPEMYSRMYVESLAVVLLSEIMNCQAADLSPARADRPTLRGGLASWQCKAVCGYIEENLNQEISQADLAAIARLSPSHFCRAFKEAIGEPPHRYQMSRRIERAKQMLTEPSLSISDVATAVGYSNAGRFSTLFGQITGDSPGKFRRRLA